jgi:hypothetical protein
VALTLPPNPLRSVSVFIVDQWICNTSSKIED